MLQPSRPVFRALLLHSSGEGLTLTWSHSGAEGGRNVVPCRSHAQASDRHCRFCPGSDRCRRAQWRCRTHSRDSHIQESGEAYAEVCWLHLYSSATHRLAAYNQVSTAASSIHRSTGPHVRGATGGNSVHQVLCLGAAVPGARFSEAPTRDALGHERVLGVQHLHVGYGVVADLGLCSDTCGIFPSGQQLYGHTPVWDIGAAERLALSNYGLRLHACIHRGTSHRLAAHPALLGARGGWCPRGPDRRSDGVEAGELYVFLLQRSCGMLPALAENDPDRQTR